MNLEDYAFQAPHNLSRNAVSELAEVNSVKDDAKRSDFYRRWREKYFKEIMDRDHDLHANASNFYFLTEQYLSGNDGALGYLRQFARYPGYYVGSEAGKMKFVCKFLEALRLSE